MAELAVDLFKDIIGRGLKEIKEALDDQQCVKQLLQETCLRVQKELETSGIKMRYSGTTFIAALVIKKHLYMCNVGDSRAVLASKIKGRLREGLATKDHNPDNLREGRRIRECGGRVSPLIDESGEPYGPHRVWNHDLTEPGLAMSRSLGDTRAHQLGVSSKPGNFSFVILFRNLC